MELLSTATRVTIDSATPINHFFHNPFFDNPACGILEARLTDHCATFVELPFPGNKNMMILKLHIKIFTFLDYENS